MGWFALMAFIIGVFTPHFLSRRETLAYGLFLAAPPVLMWVFVLYGYGAEWGRAPLVWSGPAAGYWLGAGLSIFLTWVRKTEENR